LGVFDAVAVGRGLAGTEGGGVCGWAVLGKRREKGGDGVAVGKVADGVDVDLVVEGSPGGGEGG